jgi:hypothetical protein
MDSLPHGALGKIQLIVAISGKCPQNLVSLAGRVVNDKGRYRQHPRSGNAPTLFRRCCSRLKFQVDHSRILKLLFGFRCTAICP